MKKLYTIILLAIVGTIANAQYTKLLDFAGTSNGSSPIGSLISDGIFLYGMTSEGGTNDLGTIFKIKPDGSSYTKLLDFAGTSNGSSPWGSLIFDGTFLYGMTLKGGTNDLGTIFKITPDGSSYTKLLDFVGTSNGTSPEGSLISDGTFLYGMTYDGGTSDDGVVFKIKPDGSSYAKLLDFAGTSNGRSPNGSLISDGTYLYGMTERGGINNMGVVFKIKPDGSSYTKLLDFAGTSNGTGPMGSLISDGTFLYGITQLGGTNNMGVVFKIKPDGSSYTKLLDFAGTSNGAYPMSSLISDGTFLYGMTSEGGTSNYGVIFQIKPDGSSYTKLLDFSGVTNGANPGYSSLISDGTSLYGMISAGGANDMGTIFKFQPIGMSVTWNNSEMDFIISPNPFSSLTTLQTDKIFRDATLTVYNSFGQQVKQIKNISGQTIALHRDNLSSGLYFIWLTEDNKVITTDKLVITD